ncbi:MAG: transporter substrate-binding domain-containing protein [Pseudomonadota bacterium]
MSYQLNSSNKAFNIYHNYFREVLQLSLEKTVDSYGSYKIIAAPADLTPKRLIAAAEQNLYPNLVFEMAYSGEPDSSSKINYVLFPVDFGVMGYRICFVNPAIKETIKHAKNLGDLREHTVGQGLNWVDSTILRHNGFTVNEFDNIANIFKMLTAGRVDLFCHGSNQVFDDYNKFKNEIDLFYDKKFVLKYPLPRFFYLNSNNQQLKARIENGLKSAYKDGSLLKLWDKHFKENMEFANLRKRKVFFLENPLIKNLSKEWEQYIYNSEIEINK